MPGDLASRLNGLIDALLASEELIDWLAGLFGSDRQLGVQVLTRMPMHKLQSATARAGVPWQDVLQRLLPYLLELLRWWLDNIDSGGDGEQPNLYRPSQRERCQQ